MNISVGEKGSAARGKEVSRKWLKKMRIPERGIFRVAMFWSGWAREWSWPSGRISPLPVRPPPRSPKAFRFSRGPAVGPFSRSGRSAR